MTIHIGNTTIERFAPEHTDLLYRLINSPEVRRGMSNSAEIPYESHLKWVNANLLESENVHLFIAANEEQGQGVVLLKNITEDSGELGIMVGDIVGCRRTQLTGKLVTGILYYAFHQLNFQTLNLRILPGNTNSLTVAKKIGAEFLGEDELYQHFSLSKSTYESYPLNQMLVKRYQPCCLEEVGVN